jgi:hypothetical protein
MSKPIKLVKVESYYPGKDRMIIGKIDKESYENDICLAVLVIVIEDFKPNELINDVLRETDSYQIRPKALYKNTRGVFFKDEKERRYLTLQEKIDLRIENEELGKFLFE